MAALAKVTDLTAAAELDVKLGDSVTLLGEHYLECSQALQAKVDVLKGPPEGDVHHDAFAEIEPEEWRTQDGRVEAERQEELI
jgi:hypothetical protein